MTEYVRTFDADGNLKRKVTDVPELTDVPGVGGIWDEESGSPYEVTGGELINPSALDQFDQLLVIGYADDQGGDGDNLQIEVDGDESGNYNYMDEGGSSTFGASNWPTVSIMATNERTSFSFLLLRSRGNIGFRNFDVEATATTVKGINDTQTWPPSQFSVERGSPTTTDYKVRVFGRDI